jgi:hypothetical protein
MSKLLTVTITDPVHDTLDRYMKSVNVDAPDYMRLSKSKFVDACLRAAFDSKGVPIVAYKIVDEPIVINADSYQAPKIRKHPSLPPL